MPACESARLQIPRAADAAIDPEARMIPTAQPKPTEASHMSYTPELVHELDILLRFDLATSQHGIKVHKTAAPR
jgi:hypothetical protein